MTLPINYLEEAKPGPQEDVIFILSVFSVVSFLRLSPVLMCSPSVFLALLSDLLLALCVTYDTAATVCPPLGFHPSAGLPEPISSKSLPDRVGSWFLTIGKNVCVEIVTLPIENRRV